MIPRIRKVKCEPLFGDCKYIVVGWIDGGNYGIDACETLADAIRYWLYHCNVSPKVCFWIPAWKREKYNIDE